MATGRIGIRKGLPACWAPVLLGIAFFMATNAYSAPIHWQTDTYSHLSQDENLVNLLRDFSSNQGLNVVISKNVSGTVSGRFDHLPPGTFLKQISAAYGLMWYYDGNTLFVYRSDEVAFRVIGLDYLSIEQLRQALDRLEISDRRFPLKAVDELGMVYISGPERYVSLVAETAEKMDARTGRRSRVRQSDIVIRVFVLKHAWADDLRMSFMNKEVTVPGVATLLRNIIAGAPVPGVLTGKQEKILPRTLEKLKGKGLGSIGKEDAEKALEKSRSREDDETDETAGEKSPEKPAHALVQADSRLNAVIVRDSRDRMPSYEEIISALDVPVGLVQIKATIMDISTDFLRDLGVTWRAETGIDKTTVRSDGRTIIDSRTDRLLTNSGFGATEDLVLGSDTLALGQGLAFTTILGNAGRQFLARVQALEQKGHARVLSRPSVLTLDNVEAHLEHNQTFYVRIAGDREVDLFDVSAGILLKVTPHIIDEADGVKIKLVVAIEDGDVSDTKVDDIPIVQKSTINTQAVVRENESLLIGGYYRHEQNESENSVPCLGDIPLLGLLFRQKQSVKTRFERMFLISPQIVTHDRYPAVDLGDHGEKRKEKPIPDVTEKAGDGSFSRSETAPHEPARQDARNTDPAPIPQGNAETGKESAESPSKEVEAEPTGTSPVGLGKGNRYSVQVASMASEENARVMADSLKAMGHTPVIYVFTGNGGERFFVVLSGLYPERPDADEAAARIEKSLKVSPKIRHVDLESLEKKMIPY